MVMKICIVIISLLIHVFLCVYFLIKLVKRNKEKTYYNKILWPTLYGQIGTAFMIGIFVLCIFLLIIERNSIPRDASQFVGYVLIEWTGIVLGILSCCMSLNWSVELKESTFLYTNSFGIKREYRYDEFYSKPMRACWRYYKKGRKLYLFSISYMIPNSDLLEEKLQEHNMKKK